MRDPGHFDTQAPGAPDQFALGVFKISGLRSLPGEFTYSVGDSGKLHFFLIDSDAKRRLFFWVAMIDTKRSRKAFDELVAFYRQNEKPFRMPGRKAFDPSILALPVPKGWTHDAFPARPGGPTRMIVHTYTGPNRAVIVRYSTNAADIADDPRIHRINASLKWAPAAWKIQRDYVDHGPDESTTDAPHPDNVRAEVVGAIDRARASLQLPPRASSPRVMEAICGAVDRVIEGKRPSKSKLEDLAIDLGCLWGQTVCDALKWEWRVVTRDGQDSFAIASRDRAHYIPPMVYMKRQLSQRGDSADNTTHLLFNMLKGRKLPASRPRAYLLLG
jgi:hypothetical protein